MREEYLQMLLDILIGYDIHMIVSEDSHARPLMRCFIIKESRDSQIFQMQIPTRYLSEKGGTFESSHLFICARSGYLPFLVRFLLSVSILSGNAPELQSTLRITLH